MKFIISGPVTYAPSCESRSSDIIMERFILSKVSILAAFFSFFSGTSADFENCGIILLTLSAELMVIAAEKRLSSLVSKLPLRKR